MRVFLFRHADAAYGFPDYDRPLTEKGFAQIDKLVRHLDFSEFEGIAAIEHSPLLRAAETAAYFRKKGVMRQELALCGDIRPESDPHKIALALASGDMDRLLVGHNPHHESLAGLLLGKGGASAHLEFRKASILALERRGAPAKSTPYGYWQLRWLVAPCCLA